MHILLWAVALVFAAIGLYELLPALGQLIAYILLSPIKLLSYISRSEPYEIMPQLAFEDGDTGLLSDFHGLPSILASPIFLGLSVLFGVFAVIVKNYSDKAKQEILLAADKVKNDKARREQERLQQIAIEEQRVRNLASIAAETKGLASLIPAYLSNADKAINLAEVEFKDGFLDPFWDAIEVATTEIAKADSTIRKITSNLQTYKIEAANVKNPKQNVPTIWINLNSIEDSSAAYARLRACVRNSQKNPDYSIIFHQRMTNKILVAGFTTFGQALNDLGNRLDVAITKVSYAIEDLEFAVVRGNENIIQGLNNILSSNTNSAEEISQELRKTRQNNASDQAKQRKFEEKALDIFDNIQRGREPIRPSLKPGTKRKE